MKNKNTMPEERVARQMTFKQYRAMDIGVFTLLLCISEALIVFAANLWFPKEPYTLSLVPAITAAVMMRWGLWAIVPAVAGGIVFSACSGATIAQHLIYTAGNLFFLIVYPFYKKIGWKQIHENVLLTMLYGLMVPLGMQAGRMIVSVLMGNGLLISAGFFTTDSISILFSVLIVWILRRLDGMLEDQKHYLFRVQKEDRNKKGE